MTDTVYHYCTIETFVNIMKNHSIRFSDLNKMNDYTEMKAPMTCLKNRVIELLVDKLGGINEHLIYGCANDDTIEIIVEKVFNKILLYNDVLVYGACFSEERDLLSQWCKYADNGQGVAIGFNVNALRDIVEFGNSKYGDDETLLFAFKKVKYIKQEDDIPQDYLDYASDVADNIIAAMLAGQTKNLLDDSEVIGAFLNLDRIVLLQDSVYMKDYNFIEEQEWRITYNDDTLKSDDSWWDIRNGFDNANKSVSDNSTETISDSSNDPINKLFPNGYQFRATPNDIISYMDLDFQSFRDDIINEIVIGTNCKLTCNDIIQFLLYSKYELAKDIHVDRSKVTYRK